MSYYKFGKNDKIINYAKSYPSFKFSVKGARVYLNLENAYSGAFTDKVKEIDSGFISLYEMNIDRNFAAHTYDPDTGTGIKSKIYPFITKDSNLDSFSTISTTSYNQFQYGDTLTGSYPLSSSIVREPFAANHGTTDSTGSHIIALKNTLNFYTSMNNHYSFSSSLDSSFSVAWASNSPCPGETPLSGAAPSQAAPQRVSSSASSRDRPIRSIMDCWNQE